MTDNGLSYLEKPVFRSKLEVWSGVDDSKYGNGENKMYDAVIDDAGIRPYVDDRVDYLLETFIDFKYTNRGGSQIFMVGSAGLHTSRFLSWAPQLLGFKPGDIRGLAGEPCRVIASPLQVHAMGHCREDFWLMFSDLALNVNPVDDLLDGITAALTVDTQ